MVQESHSPAAALLAAPLAAAAHQRRAGTPLRAQLTIVIAPNMPLKVGKGGTAVLSPWRSSALTLPRLPLLAGLAGASKPPFSGCAASAATAAAAAVVRCLALASCAAAAACGCQHTAKSYLRIAAAASKVDAAKLIWPVQLGKTEQVRQLLESLPADVIAGCRAALHIAAQGGHVDFVQLLLDAGVDVNAEDEEEGIPLVVAARGGFCAVLDLLLSAGAAIDAADADRCTALAAAAGKGHLNAVSLLLDRGAAVNGSDTGPRRTPLMAACGDGHSDVVELLLQASWE